MTLMEYDAVADNADLSVALDLAVLHIAAGDGAHLRHLEGLAHLGDAGVLFHDIRRQKTHARGVDVLNRLVDDAIQADVDLFLLCLLLRLASRANVEADDDRVGSARQRNVGLVDRAYAAVDTFDNDFLVGKLRQALLDCFHAALYIRFDNQVQFL